MKYLPLSVQLPDIFQELRLRQEQSSLSKPWWPSYKPSADSQPVILDSRDFVPESVALQLEKDMNAALSSSLDIVVPPPVPVGPAVKTSSTHPINVSSIVPPELLSFISMHITPAPPSYPTLFTISPSLTLDRLAPPSPTINQAGLGTLLSHSKQPRSVTEALKAAITDSFAFSVWSNNITSGPPLPPTRSLSVQSSPVISGVSPPQPPPVSLSLSLPILHATTDLAVLTDSSFASLELDSAAGASEPYPIAPAGSPLSSNLLLPPSPDVRLGNLFLSSCPGKKVRLHGPVKGRGGVCRDLEMDLRRIRQLGVGCLICCLDDFELEFLGAPWPHYESLARNNGLDVLRIPTPEGLAPLEPSSLNDHLSKVIENYTLSGIHVLVHCRGGVGRAGVIACCWLIRLGICGWIEHPLEDSSSLTDSSPFAIPSQNNSPFGSSGPSIQQGTGGAVRDTIQFVERIISFVRRRRSMKAIETYEQVRFLVEFVEYLKQHGHHKP